MKLRQKITITPGAVVRRSMLAVLLLGALISTSFPSAAKTMAARPAAKLIVVGNKEFAEEYILADMYQLLLEKSGFSVTQKGFGDTSLAQGAMLQGSLDLYPEYTGTGLVQVLGMKAISDPARAYNVVKSAYEKRFHFTWLQQTPMNDTNGVALKKAVAAKYGLHSLSDLARVAGKLTFGGLGACAGRTDCLLGMKNVYGVHFKNVKTYGASQPLIYSALQNGRIDAAEVFTTDPQIKAYNLTVLTDPKGIFPADHVAPVVRDATLTANPKISRALNPLAPLITTPVMIGLNSQVVLQHLDHLAVARTFLKAHHLL